MYALRTRQPVQLPYAQARTLTDSLASTRAWKSALFIPLLPSVTSPEAEGVIRIDSREDRDFSDSDIAIGWAIAHLIAFGWDRAMRSEKDMAPHLHSMKTELDSAAFLPPGAHVRGSEYTGIRKDKRPHERGRS